MKERHGLAAAGNWILDITKIIDVYPEQDTLSNISGQSSNNGGAPYNVLKDLSKLKAPFPLYGIGLVGEDEPGKQILEDCRIHSIDTSQIGFTSDAGTSYTDVMLVKDTGRRTFFHYRGANALFDLQHIDLTTLQAKIFHLGYLLLLDSLDDVKNDGRTNASVLLEQARALGFVTSVDLVSEQRDRFKKIVIPSLPFIDILFCNEYEAGKLTGLNLSGTNMDLALLRKAVKQLLNQGINGWVILHFPEGCIAGNKDGHFILQGSVNMPKDAIVGTTGAGDAFAAGVLFGVHENYSMEESLKMGMRCAASCLTDTSCSDGIVEYNECIKITNNYGFSELTN